jgi:HD superfamily phosphohydrolase
MPKHVKDPVHGYIAVPDELVPLLDTAPVQRLRYIRQLGFSYLVYPGANHTRFEHSLGTMHLASLVCSQLDLSRDDTLTVCTAALLHDIGHGPYSHASERLMKPFSHDDIRPFLNADPLRPFFDRNSVDAREVADIVSGNHPLAPIIHGDLDVDRMDYLLRDAHYTGVPYGMVDSERLIHSLAYADNDLVIRESGLSAAESLLIARTLMGPSVYYHHVGRIAESMFLLAAESHFAEVPDDKTGFMRMDDVSATTLFRNSPSAVTRGMAERVRHRSLYKRAVYADRELAEAERLTRMSAGEQERVRRQIAETADVPDHQVLLDIPHLRHEISIRVQVSTRHDLVPFEALVPMLSLMNRSRLDQWRLGVYAPKEHQERVAQAARSVLGLRRATKQNKLTDIL